MAATLKNFEWRYLRNGLSDRLARKTITFSSSVTNWKLWPFHLKITSSGVTSP